MPTFQNITYETRVRFDTLPACVFAAFFFLAGTHLGPIILGFAFAALIGAWLGDFFGRRGAEKILGESAVPTLYRWTLVCRCGHIHERHHRGCQDCNCFFWEPREFRKTPQIARGAAETEGDARDPWSPSDKFLTCEEIVERAAKRGF